MTRNGSWLVQILKEVNLLLGQAWTNLMASKCQILPSAMLNLITEVSLLGNKKRNLKLQALKKTIVQMAKGKINFCLKSRKNNNHLM